MRFHAALPCVCLFAAAPIQASYVGDMAEVAQVPAVPAGPAAISASSHGDFVVAWLETVDGAPTIKLLLQRRGATVSQEPMTLGASTIGPLAAPRVAMDAEGAFVAIWDGADGVYAQRYTPGGSPTGGPLAISKIGAASTPAVAMDAFGNFVVVWVRTQGQSSEIVARRFLADGTAVGHEVLVSAPARDGAGNPAVAMSVWGEFVVAWETQTDWGSDVLVRPFAADGTALLDPVSVADAPVAGRREPSVGMNADGAFVVVWNSTALDGAASIQARQFLADGTALPSEIRVDEGIPSDSAHDPIVAMDVSGDFVVLWSYRYGSYWQLFRPDGWRQETLWYGPINSLATRAIAMDADGDWFVPLAYTQHLTVSRFSGPEPVDMGASLTESADPVVPGQPLTYTLRIDNLHVTAAPTGIPAVDSAVGQAARASAFFSLSSGALGLPLPDDCVATNAAGLECAVSVLPPGGSIEWSVSVNADVQGQLNAYVQSLAHQYDPEDANDGAHESTTFACDESNGPGSLLIAQVSASVEEGEPVLATLERIGGTCGTVSAGYFSGSGNDVAYNSGQATWLNGESGLRTVYLRTLEDDVDEDPESHTVRITYIDGGATFGSPSEASYTLIDNDPEPVVTVTAPTSVEMRENERFDVVITLSRRSERGVRVPIAIDDPTNWWPDMVSRWFAWNSTREVLTFTARNDSRYDADRIVTLAFGEPANAVLPDPPTIVVTVKDDDPPPMVSIASADGAVTEGSSRTFRIVRSEASGLPTSVPLQWSGSATHAGDFTAPDVVTIPANQTFVDVTVGAAADRIDEEDVESATVTLGTPEHGGLGSDVEWNIQIQDADQTPTMQFVQPAQTVREGAGPVPIAAELSGLSAFETRMTLIVDGTGSSPADYTLSSLEIVIPPGQRSGAVTLTVVNDAQAELQESVQIQMGAGTKVVAGAPARHVVTITDDELPLPPLGINR